METQRLSLVIALLAFVTLGLGACGSSTSGNSTCAKGGTPVSTTSVTVADYIFNPACIQVSVGSTVTWTNTGMASHTVTSDKGASETFDSGPLGEGGTFKFTFASPETVNYYCIPHQGLGMIGTVVVQ
jgi:plastocyanin